MLSPEEKKELENAAIALHVRSSTSGARLDEVLGLPLDDGQRAMLLDAVREAKQALMKVRHVANDAAVSVGALR